MIFISPYNGKAVLGTVRSSVTFTWSFCGRVSTITWGRKKPSGHGFEAKLVVLNPAGLASVQAQASYTGRVKGVFVGNASSGQAKFTISDITKADAGFYTCLLYRNDVYLPVSSKDHVQLSVKD